MNSREQFAVILTDLLTLVWVGWQTGQWDVAIVGLIVQAVGFVAYQIFPEKRDDNEPTNPVGASG